MSNFPRSFEHMALQDILITPLIPSLMKVQEKLKCCRLWLQPAYYVVRSYAREWLNRLWSGATS